MINKNIAEIIKAIINRKSDVTKQFISNIDIQYILTHDHQETTRIKFFSMCSISQI